MIIRLQLDETGRIVPRRLMRDDMVLVVRRILAKRKAALKKLPEKLRDTASEVFDWLEQQATELEAAIAADKFDLVTLEPTPEVLALIPLETARSRMLVNYYLDNRIGIIGDTTDANLRRGPDQPKGKAAILINETLFFDGLTFLKESNPKQWLETVRRWQRVDEEVTNAAKLLGVDDVIEQVRVINEHFGKMQQLIEPTGDDELDEPITPQDRIDRCMPKLHKYVMNLLHLANLAWKEEDPQAEQNRRLLIGPYLDAIIEISKSASSRTTAAAPVGDSVAPLTDDLGTDTTEPTVDPDDDGVE